MRFAKIVNQLSDRVIEAICREHRREDRSLSFLLDFNEVSACWRAMSEDEKEVIRFFLQRKGTDMLTYRELEQDALPLNSIRFRVALTKLRRLGFIFTLRRMWGEQAYIISDEQVELFQQCCSPTPTRNLISETKLSGHSSYHIVDDLLQTLHAVRKTSIGFSKKGTLHKRSCKWLFQGARLSADTVAAFADSLQPQYPFEVHEAFLLSALIDQKLLIKQASKLSLGPVETWLSQDDEQLAMNLLDALVKMARVDPKLDMFYKIVRSLDRHESYRLRSILRAMGDFAPSVEHALKKCVKPLTEMGYLTSKIEEGDAIFAWRRYPSLELSSVYIQPNFEILLPAVSPFQTKWRLMGIADIVSREEMWVLRLSESSCRFAFEMGKTAAEIIEELSALSSFPIPDNVVSAIEQWERSFVQVSFWDVRLLRVGQTELADALTTIPAIASLLLERLGEKDFIIRASDAKQLADELEKRGYPLGPVVDRLREEEPSDSLRLPLFKNDFSETEYPVESAFPDLDDALPGIRQVPRMWLSNFNRYHGSTLRDLIQRAIELGLELKMERNNDLLQARPICLKNEDGCWMLIAEIDNESRARFPLEAIGRIKMVSPL